MTCKQRAFALGLAAASLWSANSVTAADPWIEVKSAHFTVTSNAGERAGRKMAWQLEQMRNAMTVVWPWMKPDLNRPLSVVLLKDAESMRVFAPEFWKRGGDLRPASMWVSGPDQHYLMIRADVEGDDTITLNPYMSAYFSYGGLVLKQSLEQELPYWLLRGLTGILSNTIVREDQILFGPIIPRNLQLLRDLPRLPLAKLLSISASSPEFRQSEFFAQYDAHTWTLAHFLIFGDEGKRAPQLNAFIRMVQSGKDASTAFTESFGTVDAVESDLLVYIRRSLFAYQRVTIDVSVQRERFPVRQVPAAESAAFRAVFHAVMGRGEEARAAIAEARKADATSAASFVAEAMILDSEKKTTEARPMYAKAVEHGTSSAYAHYRLASLMWQPQPAPELLKELEVLLSKAVERNIRYAAAYAWLGEVRASLGNADAIALIRRAIVLEPREARHRLRAANVLLRQGKHAEARVDAQAALTLASEDGERREAQELLDLIAKALRD